MVIQYQTHSLSAFLLFEFFVLCCNPKAALEKRGVGALELVAMDMKARLRTSSHILNVLARVLIPTRTEEVEHKYSLLSLFAMF
jgi:hypothetical protein